MALAFLLTACSGPSSGTSPESPSATLSPGQPSASATNLPTIGLPADDGARIVEVTAVDARTRDLTIDSPAVGSLAAGTPYDLLVKVRLLIPDGFDAQPMTRWPTLYLLHGSGGGHSVWTEATDVVALTESTDLLIVMPDGGVSGWYSDWWNDGQGGLPMWETFHTVELPQLIERNWHASDKRAVAGLSMGGYGAVEYAARHPGLFVAAASYSGVLNPFAVADVLTAVRGREGRDVDLAVWGDPVKEADVWQAHDPVNLAAELSGTLVYVSYGDGTPGPFDNGVVLPEDVEGWIAAQNETFVARLGQLGISVTVDAYGPGSHGWPYWERALHRSLPLLLEALGQ